MLNKIRFVIPKSMPYDKILRYIFEEAGSYIDLFVDLPTRMYALLCYSTTYYFPSLKLSRITHCSLYITSKDPTRTENLTIFIANLLKMESRSYMKRIIQHEVGE